MNFKKNALALLCLVYCTLFLSQIGYTQTEVDLGTYDLQFKPPTIDCTGEVPVYCVVVQIRSAIASEEFAIGAHTIYINFDPNSIQFNPGVIQPYTALNFGDGTECAFGGTRAPYFDADFDYINFQSDGTALGEGNMTTNMALANFGCPLVTNEWLDVGEFCFEIMDLDTPTGLVFNSNFTLLNLDSNNPAHTQGILDDSAVQEAPACVQCPSVAGFTPASGSEDVCSSSPNVILPSVPVSGTGSDNAILTWTQTAGPTVTVPAGDAPSISLQANTSCNIAEYTFNLAITCSDDASVSLNGGTYTYRLYPTPSTPTISLESQGATCSYSISAACPTLETLSSTNVPDQSTGSSGQTFAVTVSNGVCGDVPFDVSIPSCDDACPEQNEVTAVNGQTDVCTTDNTVQLPAISISGANAGKAIYTWTQSAGPTVTVPSGARPTVSLEANSSTNCEIVTYIFNLEIGCTTNPGVSLNGGTYSYNVYPAPSEPQVLRQDETCTYAIDLACSFETTTTTVPDKAPGAGITTIDVVVSNPACAGQTFQVNVTECPEEPIACPSSDDIESFGTEAIDLCAGQNTVSLPTATVSGANTNNVTYTWTQTAGPAVDLDQVASPTVVLSDYTGCGTETYTFSLSIGCTEDPFLSFDGGTVTYEMYPIPQSPEIVRDNDNCDYSIVLVCPNDVVSPNSIPSAAPGTAASSIDLLVTNSNCPDVERTYSVSIPACPDDGGGDVCPSQADISTVSGNTNLCGESSNLSITLSPATVGGEGASSATYSWTQTAGPSVSVSGDTAPQVDLLENTSCDPVLYTFSLAIGCSFDTNVNLDGGSVSFTVFPTPQAPTAQKTSETCSYVLVPNCDTDNLSPATIPDQLPPSIGQTINVSVSNAACPAATFEVTLPDCLEPTNECPEENDVLVFDESNDLCGDDVTTVSLPNPSFGFSTATFSWTQSSGPIVTIPDGNTPTLVLGENTSCSTVEYVFRLSVGCTEDAAISYDGGEVRYIVYPTPQAPTIARVSGECAYTINRNCNSDNLTTTSIPNQSPGFEGSTITVGVSNDGCAILDYEIAIPKCPLVQVNCPLVADITPLNDSLSVCNNVSGNNYTLPTVSVGGDFANKAVFTWTQTDGPTISIPTGSNPAVTLLQNTGCEAVEYQFTLTIGCTDDPSLSLSGGSYKYILYPEPNQPVIAKLDDVCNYSITAACTTDILSPAVVPSQALGTTGETFSVSITNAFCTKAFTLPIPDCLVLTTDCPLQSEVIPYSSSANQLCNDPAGNMISLPEVAVNSEFAANANYTWTQTAGPNVSVPSGTSPSITLPQNTSCEGISYTFKLTIGCTDDAELVLNGGEITFVVYPEPLAPTITRLNAICEYSISPACSGDILSTTTIPSQNPGSAGETVLIEVSNAGCSTAPFELSIPACPAVSVCPDQAEVTPISISDEMCMSADVKMALPYAAVTGSNADNATFTWTQTGGPTVEILSGAGEDEVVLNSNETCEAVTYTFTLKVGCLEDADISLNGGSVTYVVYPAIETPTLVRLNEICEYSIVTACPDDMLSPDMIPIQAPGTSGNTIDIQVSREGCNAETFTLEIPECTATAVPCPIEADITAASGMEEFCGESEYEVMLPAVTVSGEGANKATFTWTQLEGPSVSIDGGASPSILLSNDLDCDAITYTFQLTVGCIDDEAVSIEAGTVTYVIYPAPKAPSLENDGFNNFTVIPTCEDDSASPSAFSLAEGDDNMITILISPASNALCQATSFEVTAEILELNCPEVECRVIFDETGFIYYILVRPSGGLPETGNGLYTMTSPDGSTEELRFEEIGVLGPYFYEGTEEFIVIIDDGSGCEAASCNNLVTRGVDLNLLDFSGEAANNGNILSWTTANEVGHDYFTLYHSSNGVDFEAIAQVDGAGNPTATTNYEWLDKQAPTGISYYRLDMTDVSGHTVSSAVISLVRGENSFGIINILPVPATNFLHIDFMTPVQTSTTIHIYDYAGKLVGTRQINKTQVGINAIDIDVRAFPTGVYLLTLQNEQQIVTHKFVKQ